MKKQASIVTLQSLCLVVFPLVLGCGDSPWVPAGTYSQTANAGGNLECNAAAVQNYFGDTCASGLADMLTCWKASGRCNATVDLSGFDVEFDSGAVLEHTYTADGRNADARYVSPSGEVCGTFKTRGNALGNDWHIEFTTSGGEQYEMRPSGSNDEYEIVCANGETVPVSGAEEERLQECTGGDAVAICTRPDNIATGGDIDDIADAIGRPCTSNDQCPSVAGFNLVCCNLFGENVCYESTLCSVF